MRIYNIKVNGKKYEVQIMGISEVEPVEVKTVAGTKVAVEAKPSAPAAVAKPTSGSGTVIVSPMQGTILELKVKVGDTVKSGQTVAILEAMKLENEIKAFQDGTITEIKVSKGQQVSAKEAIIVLG